ncbi:MAG: hypothetical protein ACRCW1_05855, partial [Anaerotignaceae bacterium]
AGLQQKYNIALTERTRKSKGKLITIYEYQSEEMRKPCGEHRLGVDYAKEYLENGFIRQSQKEATREDRGTTGARARTVSASEVIRMANDTEQSNSTKREDSEQRRGNSELERTNRETAQERLRTQGSERNRANKPKNNSRSER